MQRLTPAGRTTIQDQYMQEIGAENTVYSMKRPPRGGPLFFLPKRRTDSSVQIGGEGVEWISVVPYDAGVFLEAGSLDGHSSLITGDKM